MLSFPHTITIFFPKWSNKLAKLLLTPPKFSFFFLKFWNILNTISDLFFLLQCFSFTLPQTFVLGMVACQVWQMSGIPGCPFCHCHVIIFHLFPCDHPSSFLLDNVLNCALWELPTKWFVVGKFFETLSKNVFIFHLTLIGSLAGYKHFSYTIFYLRFFRALLYCIWVSCIAVEKVDGCQTNDTLYIMWPGFSFWKLLGYSLHSHHSENLRCAFKSVVETAIGPSKILSSFHGAEWLWGSLCPALGSYLPAPPHLGRTRD